MRFALLLVAALLLSACASQPAPQFTYETAHQTYLQGDYKLAVEQLEPLASGDIRAERDLGLIYLSGGDGVSYNYNKGMGLVKRAAFAGDAPAQLEYGQLYSQSTALNDSAQHAHEWYQKAADQGSPDAEVEVGRDYLWSRGVPGNYATALSWFNKAAEAGDADATGDVAHMYLYGLGVTRDQAHALDLYQQAAAHGSRSTQLTLADVYHNGTASVQPDEALSKKYAGMAAETPIQTLQEWRVAVWQTIDSHKHYPKEAFATGEHGVVSVMFVVPDRTVAAYTIERSSGYAVFDAAAKQDLAECVFPPRAPSLQRFKEFHVDIDFRPDNTRPASAPATSAVPVASTH